MESQRAGPTFTFRVHIYPTTLCLESCSFFYFYLAPGQFDWIWFLVDFLRFPGSHLYHLQVRFFWYTIQLVLFLPYCFDFNFQKSVYKDNTVDILLLVWLNGNTSVFYIYKNDMDCWLKGVFFMLMVCFLIFEFTKWFFSCSFCFLLKSGMDFKLYL